MKPWRRKHFGQRQFLCHLEEAELDTLRVLTLRLIDLYDSHTPSREDDELAALTGMNLGAGQAPTDPALKRLLPDFYREDAPGTDATDAQVTRAMRERGMIVAKTFALNSMVELLDDAQRDRGRMSLLEADTGTYLQALTDMRLYLDATYQLADLDEAEVIRLLQSEDRDLQGDERMYYFGVNQWLAYNQDSLLGVLLP